MERRVFISILPGALLLSGCNEQASDEPSTEPSSPTQTTKRSEPTSRTTIAPFQVDDLVVLNNYKRSEVTISIIAEDGNNASETVFTRTRTLERLDDMVFNDPISKGGEYVFRVDVSNQETATKKITVPANGIPPAVGYTVDLEKDGSIEISVAVA